LTSVAQRSFSGGEIAPAFYANTNLQKYQEGLRTCRNFVIGKTGGAINRAGTEFIKEVKNSANATRLVRFQKNATDTVLMVFGNLYVRFYVLGDPVQLPSIASAWVFPFAYGFGDTVSYLGISYVNLTASNPNTTPNLNATDWYPLSGLIYELPTPYVTADLPRLQFVQSGDVVTIVHPSYAPRQLTRYGPLNWGLSLNSFQPGISTPQNVVIGAGGSAGALTYWAITAIAAETFEESLAGLANALNKIPSAGTPTAVSWDAVNTPLVAQLHSRILGPFPISSTLLPRREMSLMQLESIPARFVTTSNG
jgi:hypothetical protein